MKLSKNANFPICLFSVGQANTLLPSYNHTKKLEYLKTFQIRAQRMVKTFRKSFMAETEGVFIRDPIGKISIKKCFLYFQKNCLPWSICGVNVKQNIQAIWRSEEPDQRESRAWKRIWKPINPTGSSNLKNIEWLCTNEI